MKRFPTPNPTSGEHFNLCSPEECFFAWLSSFFLSFVCQEWEEPTQEDARRFLRNYYLSNRRTNFLGYLAMDIFYLPHRRSSDFALFSRYFMRHVIMDEMAIPNLVFGISERWGISTFSGKELWGADRHVLSKFYKKENTFIHPFKLSGDVKNEIGRKFFCETYLDDLYTEWKKQIKEKSQK